MSARLVDPVEGWLIEQTVEPVSGQPMLHITQDGGEIDPLGPVFVSTPAAVHRILGPAAFARLEPVPFRLILLW